MSTLAPPPRLDSAAVVFFGRYGEVTHLARQRQVPRQTLYREAHAVACALQSPAPREAALQQRLTERQAELTQLQAQLRQAVVIDADKQTEFVATAQALGVSLSAATTLLTVLLGPATPSRAELARRSQAAGVKAGQLLAVLDDLSRPRARQIAADELFAGQRPILMLLEQDSLCWLSGRLVERRDGPTWAAEFRTLPAAEQVTADGGRGIRVGVRLVNAERQAAQQPLVADQRDHFHGLQRARRAVRMTRYAATQALPPAEKLQAAYDRDGQAGRKRSPARGLQLHRAWTKAEQAFDRWSADETAFERLRQALRLFTPSGELNTRARGEAEVTAALAGRTGTEWTRARRLLGAEAFTFLDRVQEQLQALPVAAELRQAAVQVEGLQQRPELLRGDSATARARRGLLLAAGLLLTLAGEAGQQALRQVRGVLRGAWRSSSLVEGLNSVLRMQQARQKRLTQGLLDLKRLHWNTHEFRAGKRKRSTPYGRLGLKLPPGSWWDLLKMTPEQLRQQLSELNPAA